MHAPYLSLTPAEENLLLEYIVALFAAYKSSIILFFDPDLLTSVFPRPFKYIGLKGLSFRTGAAVYEERCAPGEV